MIIDYEKVCISQGGREILRNVDFHADKGEFIYIIGKVGSGKSSLLKTIYCELDVDSAEKMEELGRNLLTLKRREVPALRREMGIIFQDFQLLQDRSISRNLEFVLRATGWRDKNKINSRIDEVLNIVGMTDHKQKMPHELSGGEQQRIAIGRALLNKPAVIIADEPTGNLDVDTANAIISLLKTISQTGTAVVMSTHNLSMLNKYPGAVYSCDDGTLNDVTANVNESTPNIVQENSEKNIIQ